MADVLSSLCFLSWIQVSRQQMTDVSLMDLNISVAAANPLIATTYFVLIKLFSVQKQLWNKDVPQLTSVWSMQLVKDNIYYQCVMEWMNSIN